MKYTDKDHNFLGRQVAAGHYVAKSFCILAIICAFLLGGGLGYFFAPKEEAAGAFKTPLDASEPMNMPQDKQTLDSVAFFENILKTEPDNIDALTSLGHLYFDLQNPAKSVEYYERSLALKPEMPDVWVDCGVMYRALRQPRKALEYMNKALEINPKHEFALFNSGVILHNDLRDDKRAFEAWIKLLEINPQFKGPDGKLLSDVVANHQ